MKNLVIYCKDFELTEAIKAYAEEKVTDLYKYLGKVDENTVKANLRLGKTTNHHHHGKIYYADISIHCADKIYNGRVEADDIYVALSLLKDELTNNISNGQAKSRTLERKEAQKFKHAIHSGDDEI